MKLESIALYEYYAPLSIPFVTSLRRVSELEGIIVRMETDSGIAGYGEAAPTAAITGETKASICGAIALSIAPALTGISLDSFEGAMHSLNKSIAHNTAAKAAVCAALYDIRAKSLNVPLHLLLGGSGEPIETDITVSVGTIEDMANQSLSALNKGYKSLKIKMGGDPALDAQRAIACYKAAPGLEYRIDANMAWTVKGTLLAVELMEKAGMPISLVEQPVQADDLKGLKFIRDRISAAVLADESCFSAKDAIRILDDQAADMINIKLAKCGGIYEAIKIAAICEEYGAQAMVGSMMEGAIACSAAAIFASSCSAVSMADIDAPLLLREDPVIGGCGFIGPLVTMPRGNGIGAQMPALAKEITSIALN
ncbi:MAG: dipeptide epimerase [Eubacteriaceae bacterium]|nr:dipeptide epimerase [Eubacteriaceae bacterium]